MAASPKEKFEAAVNVIQSIPKNGSYQPSNDLLLKFYGYYKQATEGQCTRPKPAFWDVINKAKWDAWNRLGDMPREEAMNNYVDELKKIIETMPHTELVSEFVDKLGAFYEVVEEKPKENGDIHSTPVKKSISHTIKTYQKTRKYSEGVETDSSSPAPSVGSSPEKMDEEEDEALVPEALRLSTSTRPVDSTEMNGQSPEDMEQQNGLSDSESEGEFCDTSDLPQIDQEDGSGSGNRMSVQAEVYQDQLPDDQAQGRQMKASFQAPPSSIISRHSMENDQSSSNLVGLALTSPAQLNDRQFSSVALSSLDTYPETDSMVTMRGGGDSSQGDSQGVDLTSMLHSSGTNPTSQARGGPSQQQAGSRRLYAAGGGGTGGGRDPSSNPYQAGRVDVNDQITAALLRLQQDMSSVLLRLNTLEALTLAQQQSQAVHGREERRQETRRPFWWSLVPVSGRTLFFLLIWPFIVHWIISYLNRRPRRR